jgi:DNA-binding winged helix-turn-helix (wHTH) protein/tetratricopeptide (TPR) repeat protein
MVDPIHSRYTLLHFGVFELNLKTGELRKAGTRVSLSPQPFKLLVLLASRPGELVTREEIRQGLWGSETFVDFEQGLNFAVSKIRSALSDNAGAPHYIETLPRRGYRFLGLVSGQTDVAAETRRASGADFALDLRSISPSDEATAVRPASNRRSVAVVPFRLLIPIPEDQFLSAALADAVVNRLGSTGKLVVRPTASMMRYAQAEVEWTTVAGEMNVDVVVEASIQRIGPRVRVLVQVHQFSASVTLYSDKHDGDMGDLFSLQDRIADAVYTALLPPARSAAMTRASMPPTKNALAYELFMRAADRVSRLNKWDAQTAIEMLSSATQLDPTFADGWGRLAQACIQMGSIFDSDPRWFQMAEDAVARTLDLDMANADAFCARGQVLWTPRHSFQNQAALRALNASLKLNPGCHQAQLWRGQILFHLGLYQEARQGLEEALASHPEDGRAVTFLALTALYRGDYAEAQEHYVRALSLDPTSIWPNLFLPLVPLYMGRPADALEKVRVARQMLPEEPALISVEGMIAAYEGDFARAEQLADAALEQPRTMLHTHHLWHNAAAVFSMCGKPERAVPWLQRSAQMGLPNYLLFSSDPHLRSLQHHPDFMALMTDLRREHEAYREEFGAGA